MLKRNIKSVLWVTLLLCLGTLNANAQKRWFRTSALEFGLIGGFSHYSGELTPAYFDARGLKPSAGIITRYTPNSLVTFRLSAQYGKLEGDDKWSGETETQARNLNFQSDIWDFTGAAEFNFNYIDFRQKTPDGWGNYDVFENPDTSNGNLKFWFVYQGLPWSPE